jgi:hypothetical protein
MGEPPSRERHCRQAGFLRVSAALALVGVVCLAAPPCAEAAHFVDEGNGCYSCHSLDAAADEPESKFIASASRTTQQMKAARGGRAPARFGCTYCHSRAGNTAMREVLSHFIGKASQHPVGRSIVTGKRTGNAYVSAIDSSSVEESDCVDCHDPGLLDDGTVEGAVDHVPPDSPLRAGNPLMLRHVTVPGEYDELCRSCHGSAAPRVKGRSFRVASHGDAAATPIREQDGTNLKTTEAGGKAQCTRCHDSHSSGLVKLLNDGHEGDAPIVGTDCTAVCHAAGGEGAGHGRDASTYRYRDGAVDDAGLPTTMKMGCTACHLALDTGDTSPQRRRHAETPTGGTIQENYRTRYNLTLPLQEWDRGSPFGNPLVGICGACHPGAAPHETSAGKVGCQDCHDVHGRGAGSNTFMIPAVSRKSGTYGTVTRPTAGTELVTYATARLAGAGGDRAGRTDLDFFRPDGAGVCDNAECHAVEGRVPLSAFMAGGSHSGGEQQPGSDCGSCHRHNGDPGGGWRAASSCSRSTEGCHGTQGVQSQPDGTVYPDRAGRHASHIARIAAVNGLGAGGIGTCAWCHPGGRHSGDQDAAPADLANGSGSHFKSILGEADSGEKVVQSGGNVLCAGVDCHYNWPPPPGDWYGTAAPGCTYCHADAASYLAGRLPEAHDRHVLPTPAGGYAYACTVCHPAGEYGAGHQDGRVSVSFSLPWGGDGNEAATGGTGAVRYGAGPAAGAVGCAGVSCHGDYPGGNTANVPNWHNTGAALGGAGSGDGRCGSCHGTAAEGDPLPAYPDGTPKANQHPTHGRANGYGCEVCHATVSADGRTVTDRARHASGSADVAANPGGAALHRFSWTAPSCVAACHGGNAATWSDPGPASCAVCHGYVDGVLAGADVKDFAWAGEDPTMSKISFSQYTAASGGHGSAVPRSIKKGCNEASCHDSSAGHDTSPGQTGENPFRLVDQSLSAGLQYACDYSGSGCHTAGLLGPQSGIELSRILSHSKAAVTAEGIQTKRTWPAWNPQCVNCHDPHGDGTLSMLSSWVYDKAAFSLPSGSGLPPYPAALPPEQAALVFTDATTGATASGSSYADLDAPWSGLCQECHEDPTVLSFHDGPSGGTAAGTNHPGTGANPGDCNGCHRHDRGFMPARCANSVAGCHGTTDGVAHPDGASYPDRDGKHRQHVARINAVNGFAATSTGSCVFCHPGGGHSGDQLSPPADLVNGATAHFRTIDGVPDVGDSVSQSGAGVTCSGVNCHYNSTPPAADWYGTAQPGCTYCHADGVAPYLTGQLPNAHDRHVGESAGGGYNLACTVCHPSGAYLASHQNGTADVSFSLPWGGDGDEAVAGAGGAVKFGAGGEGDYYSCAGIPCHGDYPGGNPANAPNWRRTDVTLGGANSGDGRCGSCHGTAATADPLPVYEDGGVKANKHPIHHQVNGYGCELCHATVTADGRTVTNRANHANGVARDVASPANGTPALYRFAWEAPNCTAACHGGATLAWNDVGPLGCDGCHGTADGEPASLDVKDFAWAGASPTMSKIAIEEYTAAGGGHGSVAPREINKPCAACHDSAAGHDTSAGLTGANPFRLVALGTGGRYACDYSGAGCHAAGLKGPQTGVEIAKVRSHTRGAMTTAGYEPRRAWSWDPQCTNCHDPHGDGNLSMIARGLYDKAPFGLPGGPPPAPPAEQPHLVFTDATTGANPAGTSYAGLDAPFSGLCQECHEDAGMVSFRDGATAAQGSHPGPAGNPGDCSQCHKHTTGFAGAAPVDFSDCVRCHDGSDPKAPNVINGPLPGSDGLSYNWYGTDGSKQDGGHGDPEGRDATVPKPVCTDCHDLSQPPGDLHGNGVHESIWDNTTRNENTAHLKAAFFTRFTPLQPGPWSIQVSFDKYCLYQCHVAARVPWYFHHGSTKVTDPNHWAVEMGKGGTTRDGDAVPYPLDKDLNDNASGSPFYAPCVSCHDPHGTTLVPQGPSISKRPSNRMLRDNWNVPNTLCLGPCHL